MRIFRNLKYRAGASSGVNAPPFQKFWFRPWNYSHFWKISFSGNVHIESLRFIHFILPDFVPDSNCLITFRVYFVLMKISHQIIIAHIKQFLVEYLALIYIWLQTVIENFLYLMSIFNNCRKRFSQKQYWELFQVSISQWNIGSQRKVVNRDFSKFPSNLKPDEPRSLA